ncbi:MAG: hypothetical protein H6Q90_5598, partial [Deltaproteobacteria bacterium]|nr:hypothetical protein [Deltaproteobacteria bacterium]
MIRIALAVAWLVACGSKHAPEGSGGAGSAGGATAHDGLPAPDLRAVTCTQLPFESTSPVHEASGAAWMPIGGKPALVVIGDSGNEGEYAIIDPDSGKTLELGKLPLGGPGDDLEGVAVRGGKLVALTSPGWIQEWVRNDAAKGFELV